MEDVHCPLCHHRISHWEWANGKTILVNEKQVHKSCLMYYNVKEVEVLVKK